jgi:hypothetical protein
MTTAMNDLAIQNMFLLIDYILPHKTSLKLGGRILNKGAIFFTSTYGAPTLVDFYINVE